MTAFDDYFSRGFEAAINTVGDEIVSANGLPISRASWDRKAAYLLWNALGRPGVNLTIEETPAIEESPIDDEEWDIL